MLSSKIKQMLRTFVGLLLTLCAAGASAQSLGVAASFSPSSFTVGGTGTVTILVSNPAFANGPVSSLQTSSPITLSNMQFTSVNSNSCPSIISFTASQLTLTPDIAAPVFGPGTSCTIAMNVSALSVPSGTLSVATNSLNGLILSAPILGPATAVSVTAGINAAATSPLTVNTTILQSSVRQGARTTMTITFGSSVGMTAITALATTTPITLNGFDFTSPSPISSTCPSTITGVASNQVSLAPLAAPAFGDTTPTCQMTFNITAVGAPGTSGGITIAPNSFTTTVTPFSGPAITNVGGPVTGASATATILPPPPTLTVAVAPTTLRTFETTTATYTLTGFDPGGVFIASGIINMPAGVSIQSSPAPANTCGTFGTIGGGGSQFSFGMGFVPNGSCTITLAVRATAEGTFTLGVGPGDLNGSSVDGNTNTSSAAFSAQAPFLSPLSASPATVFAGGQSTITYRITNPGAAAPASGTVTLPTGFSYSFPPTSTCGLTFTGSGNQFSFSGSVGPIASPCDITVLATTPSGVATTYAIAVAAGNLIVGSSTNTNNSNTPLATILPSAPGVSVTVTPASVLTNVNASLVYVLGNSNPQALPITSGSFSIPANINVSGVNTTCAGASATFTPSPSAAIVIFNGSIPANGTCTVTASVNSLAVGAYTFNVVPGSLTAVVQNTNTTSATLTVSTVSPASYTLTEAGVAVTGLNFASQPLNTTSAVRTLVVTSTGGVPLNISGVAVVGSEFPFTTTCPAGVGIPNGSTCTISVSFAPNTAGVRTSTLAINSNAAAPTVPLTGIGVQANVGLSAASLTFAAQIIGTTSAAQTITLSNTGAAPLVINSIATTGDFAATSNCPIAPATLANGTPPLNQCTINVTFTPTSTTPAARVGSLLIGTANAPTNSYTINLDGTASAIPVPALIASPATIAFAPRPAGTVSSIEVIAVTNTGTANATGIALTIPPGYARVVLPSPSPAPDCGVTLAPATQCAIAIVFAPGAPGVYNGTFSVTAVGVTSPATVAFTGAATPAPVPVVSLSGALNFGDQIINTQSAAQNVTISNIGTATLTVSSVSIGGVDAASFAATNTCGSVGVGASCTVPVTFRPTTLGTKAATLNIVSDAQNTVSANAVVLTGNGIPVPRPIVSLDLTTVSFGNTIFGGAAATQTMLLRNTGALPLAISGIVLSPDFVQVNNCPANLAPQASCAVQVQFVPTGLGPRVGDLSVISNAVTSPDRVALRGVGCRWFSPTNSRLFTTLCGN